jgi:hypothetical protein
MKSGTILTTASRAPAVRLARDGRVQAHLMQIAQLLLADGAGRVDQQIRPRRERKRSRADLPDPAIIATAGQAECNRSGRRFVGSRRKAELWRRRADLSARRPSPHFRAVNAHRHLRFQPFVQRIALAIASRGRREHLVSIRAKRVMAGATTLSSSYSNIGKSTTPAELPAGRRDRCDLCARQRVVDDLFAIRAEREKLWSAPSSLEDRCHGVAGTTIGD